MAAPFTLLLQEVVDFGPVELWWLWLLIALGFLAIIIYLVGRIGPGGPWMQGR